MDAIGRDDTSMDTYFSGERVRAIRGICIEIMNRLDVLLYDDSVATDEDERHSIYQDLPYLRLGLEDLGITPLMRHTPDWLVKLDPTILAEFVAGHLFPYTHTRIFSRGEIRPLVQRLGVRRPDGSYKIRIDEETPSEVQAFYHAATIVDMGYDVLRACAERNPEYVGQVRILS